MTLDGLTVARDRLVAAVCCRSTVVLVARDRAAASPDLLLVTLVGDRAAARLGHRRGRRLRRRARSSTSATLGTLGVTSLLLRSPATGPAATARRPAATGRTRRSSPSSSLTVLVAVGGLALHFMLGEEVSARRALLETLLPEPRPEPAPRRARSSRSAAACSAAPTSPARVAGGAAPWLARSTSAARPRAASCRPTRRSHEPYRLTPQLALRVGDPRRRSRSASSALLFLRLWSLQVLSGDRYLDAAQNNQLRTIRVEAPRGAILDRNGPPIVSNVPGTAVQIWVSRPAGARAATAMLRRLGDDPRRAAAAAGARGRGSARATR